MRSSEAGDAAVPDSVFPLARPQAGHGGIGESDTVHRLSPACSCRGNKGLTNPFGFNKLREKK